VEIPSRTELLERLRRVPGAATVLDRLTGAPPVAVVGGVVRDVLLGATPVDLDLVVQGPIGAVLELLDGQLLDGDLRAHERFGTARLTLAGQRLDIASARSERYDRPGALPRVGPASIVRDLERRDFTVNAIAVPVNGPGAGEVIATLHALEDLAAGSLRVLHDASFQDDPTRLLRLARYAARLDFTIDAHTLALATAAVRGGALANVSGTRIGNELRLLAREPDPIRAFAATRELGIDRALDPDFGLTDDAWAARGLELLGDAGAPERLVLALAVRRLAPERARALLDRLAFAREDRDAVVAAASTAPALSAALGTATRPSEVAAAVHGAGPEAIALAGAIGPAEAARSWLFELRHMPLLIDGRDLLDAGLAAGPAIGRGLAAARAAALDGRAADRQAQLAVAIGAARAAAHG